MKALVIGAGPTGLTAALALAAGGMACRIVERRTAPSALSRAVGIMPATIEALRTLGVADPILAEAMPLRKVLLTRAGKILMRLDNRSAEFRDRIVLGLPQNRTEEILSAGLSARDIHVEYGLSVDQVTPHDQSVTAAFSDGTSDTYDWVIAADGLKSGTREQLGIAYPGKDLPGEWSIADVDVGGEFDPELVIIDAQAPGNNFTMVLPIEQKRARIVSSTPDALTALAHPLTIENVRRTATFRISICQAEAYRKGRVLLAGDAAHCHSPVGGKGMNLGMADAVAAARAIISGTVDDYSAERHRMGRDVLKTTENARTMATSNKPMSKAILWIAAKAVASLPFAHRAFMRALTKV